MIRFYEFCYAMEDFVLCRNREQKIKQEGTIPVLPNIAFHPTPKWRAYVRADGGIRAKARGMHADDLNVGLFDSDADNNYQQLISDARRQDSNILRLMDEYQKARVHSLSIVRSLLARCNAKREELELERDRLSKLIDERRSNFGRNSVQNSILNRSHLPRSASENIGRSSSERSSVTTPVPETAVSSSAAYRRADDERRSVHSTPVKETIRRSAPAHPPAESEYPSDFYPTIART